MHGLKKLFSFLRSPTQPARSSVREKWQNHLEAWQQSGLQQIEYCRRNNLSYDNFRTWKKVISKSPGTSIKLVEVKNTAHEFKLQDSSNSFHSGTHSGYPPGSGPHGVRNESGIGMWWGEFYIEVAENFSAGCLSQLIHVLHHSNCRSSNAHGSGLGGEDVATNAGR